LKDHNLKKRAQQSVEMFLKIQYVGAYYQLVWLLLPPLPGHPPVTKRRETHTIEMKESDSSFDSSSGNT